MTMYVKIHGMTCPNRCRHCYCWGGARRTMIPYDRIVRILRQAAALKSQFSHVIIQFFDEPTVHPRFLDIMEMQYELGVTWDGWFVPTNGYGLARMDVRGWERLKALGNPELQLTFYGIESDHDLFAGRAGAYADLIAAIRMAAVHEVVVTAGIVVWPGNIRKLSAIQETIRSLAEGKVSVGWFFPAWQGRGQDRDLRCRSEDCAGLNLSQRGIKRESEHREEIVLDDAMGSRSADDAMCSMESMEVYPDLRVVFGGACDSMVPKEYIQHFTIGRLTDGGFDPLLERLRTNPPDALRILRAMVWRDLALAYGDPEGDEMFHINDLIANKWATAHLDSIFRKRVPR
ncbi:radical SAM protein [bacterium]|nr:radical SAM protein [candidate division CSSED10-310 bacterium]